MSARSTEADDKVFLVALYTSTMVFRGAVVVYRSRDRCVLDRVYYILGVRMRIMPRATYSLRRCVHSLTPTPPYF